MDLASQASPLLGLLLPRLRLEFCVWKKNVIVLSWPLIQTRFVPNFLSFIIKIWRKQVWWLGTRLESQVAQQCCPQLLKDSSQTLGFHFKRAGSLGGYSFIRKKKEKKCKKKPSDLWGAGYSRRCAGWAGGSCRSPCERHRLLAETAELTILAYLCGCGRSMVPHYFNLHISIINIVFCMS